MSIRGFAPGKTIESPRGAWASLTNRRKGVPSRSSEMQNMRVRYGTVHTRPGTSSVFPTLDKVTGMFNWITPGGDNLLLYQDGPAIYSYRQQDNTSVQLVGSLANRAPSFTTHDVWAYFCGYDTAGNGAFQARVFDGVNIDVAFRAAPILTGWATADSGPGLCTQGTHFFGLVYQNRNGYAGKPVTGISYPITATSQAPALVVTATSNTSPDILTVPGHTFVEGNHVRGVGATGDTAIIGNFIVTNVVGANLELTAIDGTPVAGNGVYTGGGTLQGPAVVLAPGNNIQTGQQVSVAGALGDTAINGVSVATVVVTANTFSLTDLQGGPVISNGVYAGGGVLTNSIQIDLTAAGPRQITVQVTIPGFADGGMSANGGIQATMFLIMTRADNPNLWYFIPNDTQTGQIGELPVALNTVFTGKFIVNLSDEDIASQLAGDTAQANFFFLTQDENGNGPFLPNFVGVYGQRTIYGAGTTLYASDIDNPQQIAADTNAVRLPNQRYIAMAFQLAGNTGLYVTGDRWLGYVTDNNDSPSTWAPPVNVSDALGAPLPNCVCFKVGGNWAWIVTEGGPYLFDGAFGEQPLTYLVSGYDETRAPIGWNRVNWQANYAIQITDDVNNLKLYVGVPLDGATECNYMFCIDYRAGKTFDTCDISLDVFNPQMFSALGIVKNFFTGLAELWIGPTAVASTMNRLDVAALNDVGGAIDNYWTSGLARGTEISSSMIRVGGMDIWARGNAPLDANGNATYQITLFGPDGVESVDIELMTTNGVAAALIERPGIKYMSQFDINQIENYFCRFRTNALGAWQELSGFCAYEKQDLFNR